jgi:hypothetical protein
MGTSPAMTASIAETARLATTVTPHYHNHRDCLLIEDEAKSVSHALRAITAQTVRIASRATTAVALRVEMDGITSIVEEHIE